MSSSHTKHALEGLHENIAVMVGVVISFRVLVLINRLASPRPHWFQR